MPTPSSRLAPPSSRLGALVDRQAGVVSRAQALAAGLAPREVDRHLARRHWHPVHPRVYLVDGHPLTDEARVRSAALWVGAGAVVVGPAAVWWHGLAERAPATVEVAVARRCTATRPGVLVRSRHLPDRDVVAVRGLAVPVRPLALLDAAVEAGAGGPALLHRALRHDVGLGELHAVARRSAGAATAARLLAGLHAGPAQRDGPGPAQRRVPGSAQRRVPGSAQRRVPGPGRRRVPGEPACAPGGRRVTCAAMHRWWNGRDLGIATVHCEHRIHPRGRPGPVAFPGAR